MFFNQFEKLELGLHGVRLPEIVLSEDDYKNAGAKPGISNLDFLKQICKNGFERKIKEGKIKEEDRVKYRDRFKTEIEVFIEGGFVDYVLLVWDIINFAKKNGIALNFGRGSGAGSLTLYLCGIIEIDPIQHKLYFERFVSKARIKKNVVDGITYLDGSKIPDVDVDASAKHRDEIVKYVLDKYQGKSCKLSTYSTLTSKILIKECGKIVGEFSEQTMNEVSGFIESIFGKVRKLEESYVENEHFRKFCDENPEVYTIAQKLHGLIKSKGSHASGYLVSFDDLNDCIPVEFGTNGEIVSGYDMYDASEIAVKVDLLGLQDLDLISETCKRVGINLFDIDIHDPFIYECLQDLKAPFGLFQICGDATFRATQKIKPKNFEHLCSILAISRPGSIAFVDKFAKYTNSGELEPFDEHLDKVFNVTGNVPLFQESLMQCAHEVFGLSLEDAEGIRRACSKKVKEDMIKYESMIYSQAEKLGLPKETAKKFISMLINSADYSFNKCLDPSGIVETEDGQKELREIKVGDKIRAYDQNNQKDNFVEVLNVYKNKVELFSFILSNGCEIICSMEHKFLTRENGMVLIKEIIDENFEIIINEEIEYYRDIPSYKGFYKVSNKGNVMSCPRIVSNGRGGFRLTTRTLMSTNRIRRNYKYVPLNRNGKTIKYSIHRLVAKTFLENPDRKDQVNHKDGNKFNNNLENLEWVTDLENRKHAYKLGLKSKGNTINHKRGEDHHWAKFSTVDILRIRQDFEFGKSCKDLSLKYNVNRSCIERIVKRKTYSHIL